MSSMPRTHRASAQRRRAALLDATRELIGEIGAGAITHRAVASRAGVTLSTTSYFFDSIDDLVAEALREQNHDQIAAFDEAERTWILGDEQTARENLAAIARMLGDRPLVEKATNVESYLASGRNPEAAESLQTLLTRFAERIAALHGEPDSARARSLGRNLLAITLGTSLHEMAALEDTTEHLIRGLEDLIAGALLTDEERAELFARIDEHRRPSA